MHLLAASPPGRARAASWPAGLGLDPRAPGGLNGLLEAADVRVPLLERPRGEWNTLELYCLGQRSVHVVNGHVVMRLSGIRQPTPATQNR